MAKECGCKILDDAFCVCKVQLYYFKCKFVIGVNAVNAKSTGEYEIWAGIPAKFVNILSIKTNIKYERFWISVNNNALL